MFAVTGTLAESGAVSTADQIEVAAPLQVKCSRLLGSYFYHKAAPSPARSVTDNKVYGIQC